MDGLSPTHLILVAVVALLVIGPAKLPETAAALGKAVHDFRHAMDGTEPTTSTAPTSTPGPTTRPPTA